MRRYKWQVGAKLPRELMGEAYRSFWEKKKEAKPGALFGQRIKLSRAWDNDYLVYPGEIVRLVLVRPEEIDPYSRVGKVEVRVTVSCKEEDGRLKLLIGPAFVFEAGELHPVDIDKVVEIVRKE